MKKRLAVYMIALGGILVAALIAGLFLLNQLKSPREELAKTLHFRMEAFTSDMDSLWRNVAVMGVHLSEDMSAIVEAQTHDLSSLRGDTDAVERLEEAMLEPLCQYVRQTDSSGAFVLLDASLGSSGTYSGLYVQRSNAAHNHDRKKVGKDRRIFLRFPQAVRRYIHVRASHQFVPVAS